MEEGAPGMFQAIVARNKEMKRVIVESSKGLRLADSIQVAVRLKQKSSILDPSDANLAWF
jgi:hypothetical protein